MGRTLEDILKQIMIDKRVCPKPIKWNAIYNLLLNTKRSGVWEPLAPLILTAWHLSGDREKKERFISHLEWAQKHGNLDKVFSLIESFKEKDWHHEGEY